MKPFVRRALLLARRLLAGHGGRPFVPGRGVDPGQRCTRKGADLCFLVHCGPITQIMEVETALHREFENHPLYRGKAPDARGGMPRSRYGCAYLAFGPRRARRK